MNYKYKTTLSASIKPLVSEEKDKYLAEASLKDLKNKLPDIDTSVNADLLPFSCQLYNSNRGNKNLDIVDTETALKIRPTFINKPLNLEHSRGDAASVVGSILSTSLSSFAGGEELSEEDVKDTIKPFSVNIAGIVWKVINSKFAEVLEESNESVDSPKIFASFEVGFNDFDFVLLKGRDKNLEDGEIVSEASRIKEIQASLGEEAGGGGKIDKNTFAYRRIKGDALGLGAAFTLRPAAELLSVITDSNEDVQPVFSENSSNSERNRERRNDIGTNKISVNSKEKSQNFSTKQNKSVNKRKKTVTMSKKLTNIKDLTQEAITEQEVDASTIRDTFEENLATEIEKANQEWKETLSQKDKEIQDVQKRAENAEAKQKELQEQYDQVKADADKTKQELDQVKAQIQERVKQDTFNARMAEMEEKYELTKEDKKAIAAQIKDLSEEQYADWKEKMHPLIREKDKEVLAKKRQQESTQETQASSGTSEETDEDKKKQEQDETVANAVDNAESKREAVVNTATRDEEDFLAKYEEAFSSENLKVEPGRGRR